MQLEFGKKPNVRSWSPEERKVFGLVSTCLGRENGIFLADLARDSGVEDTREVRRIVKHLIEKRSQAICSGATGFYVPIREHEIIKHKRALLSQAFSMMRRARSLESGPAIKRLMGQLNLELQKLERRQAAIDKEGTGDEPEEG